MLEIILGVIVFISILLIMIIIINNKFQFSIIKIDKAEEDISLYLDKKKELLDRCRPTIKKELKLENFLDELDESFDDVNSFSLHDTLKKCYNELFKTLDENEKLFKSESLVSILEGTITFDVALTSKLEFRLISKSLDSTDAVEFSKVALSLALTAEIKNKKRK